jgi:diguanylate cyclase (GGDEF)-like protein
MPPSNIAQRFSGRFIALCDRYVHADWLGDETLLFRARFHIGIMLAYQVIVTAALVYVLLLSPLPVIGKVSSTILLGGTGICFNVLMRRLRHNRNLRFTAEVIIATAFLAIEAGIVMTGGPLHTTALGVMVVPPVVAMCLVGWRHGVSWGVFVFAVQMLLIVADVLGLQFPNVMLPEQVELHRIFDWSIVFPALIGIVLVYQTLNSHLQRDRDQQQQRHEYLATHDVLTGLANRKQLIEKLNAMLLRMQRKSDVAAVVYLDLDGFKRINDTFGHEGGDQVLQIVAQRLQGMARKGDVLARMGGDEFAILMEDIGNAANAEHAVLRFQQVISETMAEFPQFSISGSFGIAMAPTVSTDAMTLMQVADQAMYLAKKQRQIVVTVNAPVASNAVQVHQEQAGIISLHAIATDELHTKTTLAGTSTGRLGPFGWMQKKFLEHCDRILAPELRADPDQLIRGRTLIGMARFIQAALVFIITILWFNVSSTADNAVMLGVAIFASMFSALIAYLHRTANLSASINIMLFIAFVAVQGSTLINGGIAKSPAIDVVVLPVLMAFCLSGRKLGLIWAALTLLFHVGVAIVIRLGVDVALVQKEQLAQETIGAWGIAYVATLFIIYVFESVNVRLQQERDKEYDELEFLATHDALTGLANRRKFHESLTLALERMHSTRESLAVIYLDLDGFKPVNDTLGHAVGDIVLQTVAKRIGRNVRSIDTVARLGGDEFGILLSDVRTLDDVAQIASKIRHDISRPIGGLEMFPVSGSIGIAMAPQHSDDGDTLVRMADQAMFRAKAVKDTVELYQ